MNECKPRLAGALVGDIERDPGAKIKYGYFFKALAEHFPLVEVYDASLHGVYRYLNALRAFHPSRQRWRENFYKNVPAFRLRSQLADQHFQAGRQQIDMVIQIGVLFNARWRPDALPSIIYTDYTAHLTAQRPSSGRSPFSRQERQQWLALERDAFSKASHICTRSELVRQSIIRDYGIPSQNVSVIGGGINFAHLPPVVKHHHTDEPTILFIGKELYRKGGDILLEAFAQVRQSVPGARLKMLTAEPIPPHFPTEGVDIIRPTWNRQKIADLYLSADIFVLPSRLETWGDVLVEAMSYGLPCIGVAGQAMEEIIEHGFSGLICPAEDISSLAECMLSLLTDVQLRCRLGQQARIKAEKTYKWPDVVHRLSHCIRQVEVNY